MHEGELITTWTGDGKDAPYQSKVCRDYALPRCQQRDASQPYTLVMPEVILPVITDEEDKDYIPTTTPVPDKVKNEGTFKIYFKCEESVLKQMQRDGVEILWSGKIVEEEI